MTRFPTEEQFKSWPAPNYAHPVSRGNWLITVEIVLFVITTLVVLLRIYTRGWVIKSFGIDDWLIIPAAVLGLGLTTATCLATVYGYGIHVWDIRPERRGITLQFAFANMLLFTSTVTITKLSILFFYLRLGTSKTFRNVVYVCMALVSAWGIVYILVNIFYCVPIAAYWDITLPQQNCISEGGSLISNAVINMILDIILILIPIPLVWKVQLPQKQRTGLIAMFALGFLVCIAGVMRLVYVIETVKSYDGTWDGFMCWVWVAIECDIGILTACIPSLKPLLSKINTSVRATSVYTSARRSARGTRLASRATTLNTRTHLDSVWDASDEQIYKNGAGHVLTTTVQGGAEVPAVSAKDGAGLRRSGSVNNALSRKNTFVDPYRRREKDLEEGMVTYDLHGDGKGEDGVVTMALWDVVKTTEIEVTSNASEDDSGSSRKVSFEK